MALDQRTGPYSVHLIRILFPSSSSLKHIMTDSSDPVRIGNPNNLQFRSLQDLDQDILPIIAANIRTQHLKTIQEEAEGDETTELDVASNGIW